MNKKLMGVNNLICPHCKHETHIREYEYTLKEGDFMGCSSCTKSMEIEYISEPTFVICTKKTNKG